MIEEMSEQIKKLQDVLIEYAKSDDSAHIVQQQDDPSNQIILKTAAKQGVTAESNEPKPEEKTANYRVKNGNKSHLLAPGQTLITAVWAD